MKKILVNIVLLLSSVICSLFLAEGLIRVVYTPVDYLQPEVLSHKDLGHIIAPNTGGHDDWGFRNKQIPTDVDLVAIGDSQTYGDSATSSQSWPSQLADLTEKSVFNMAIGGYGPGHYLYLLENNAIKLNPKKIVVGLYLGNDLIDSYNYAHQVVNDFSGFRKKQQEHPVRFWLSGHSVLYRMITFSGLGDLIRRSEVKKQVSQNPILSFNKPPLFTVFTPEKRLSALDLTDSKVNEGLNLSMNYLLEIQRFCLSHQLHLTILLIPTKELVYSSMLTSDQLIDTYKHLVENEVGVKTRLEVFFKEHQIEYVDPLPELRKAAEDQQIYPVNDDGHPNKNGYHIIAQAVANHLRQD